MLDLFTLRKEVPHPDRRSKSMFFGTVPKKVYGDTPLFQNFVPVRNIWGLYGDLHNRGYRGGRFYYNIQQRNIPKTILNHTLEGHWSVKLHRRGKQRYASLWLEHPEDVVIFKMMGII